MQGSAPSSGIRSFFPAPRGGVAVPGFCGRSRWWGRRGALGY